MSDAPADAFEAQIAAAQADLARSIDRAGLRDDPYRFPLVALSMALGTFPGLLQRMDRVAEVARMPLDTVGMTRLEQAAAQGASRHVESIARAHCVRSSVICAVALAVAFIVGLIAGYWRGQADTIDSFQAADAALSQWMRDDPETARGWVNLLRLNDFRMVMASCRGGRAFKDPTGRQACLAALWIEPAKLLPTSRP